MWSKATQTSPASSGSCMKSYEVERGLVVSQIGLNSVHIASASALLKVRTTPPV